MGQVEKIFFRAEREEKISLFPVALWRICFYFCTLKPPSNQLHMEKKHITDGQRYEISAYLRSGKKKEEIAEILGFNKSSISRDIKRNSDKRDGSYKPELAIRKH